MTVIALRHSFHSQFCQPEIHNSPLNKKNPKAQCHLSASPQDQTRLLVMIHPFPHFGKLALHHLQGRDRLGSVQLNHRELLPQQEFLGTHHCGAPSPAALREVRVYLKSSLPEFLAPRPQEYS